VEPPNDNEYLRGLPTEQLEDLARRPDIPDPHQRVIRSELVDRYMLELSPPTVHTGQVPPLTPGVREPGPAAAPDPAAPRTRPRGRRSRLPVLAAAVVVITAVILAGRTYVEHRARPTVPASSHCDLGGGYACTLDAAGALGQSCVCVIGEYRYSGVLR